MHEDRFQNKAKRPNGCPFCGYAHVDEGMFEEEYGLVTRTDACPECDGTWRLEFGFKQMAVVLHPSTLEQPVTTPGTVLSLADRLR